MIITSSPSPYSTRTRGAVNRRAPIRKRHSQHADFWVECQWRRSIEFGECVFHVRNRLLIDTLRRDTKCLYFPLLPPHISSKTYAINFIHVDMSPNMDAEQLNILVIHNLQNVVLLPSRPPLNPEKSLHFHQRIFRTKTTLNIRACVATDATEKARQKEKERKRILEKFQQVCVFVVCLCLCFVLCWKSFC